MPDDLASSSLLHLERYHADRGLPGSAAVV